MFKKNKEQVKVTVKIGSDGFQKLDVVLDIVIEKVKSALEKNGIDSFLLEIEIGN